MSRAIVIATASRHLFAFWLKNFKLWSDKIDRIYISNNTGEKFDYPIPAVELRGVEYPKSVEKLLSGVAEDQVLIMHDDVFVFDPMFIDMCFELARTKIVTPIHNSHNGNVVLEQAMQEKFGHHDSFFPYFVFCPMSAVKKTSINLHEYNTDNCRILGVPASGDQGFLFSLELQVAGYELFPIRRYLAHEFPVNPPWVHAQALSYNFMAGMNNGMDEYKLSWLIKLVNIDIKKLNKIYERLFNEQSSNTPLPW